MYWINKARLSANQSSIFEIFLHFYVRDQFSSLYCVSRHVVAIFNFVISYVEIVREQHKCADAREYASFFMNKDETKSLAKEGHLQLICSSDIFSEYREIDKFNVALNRHKINKILTNIFRDYFRLSTRYDIFYAINQ